jgi:iron complex transport system permease protein
MKLRRIMTILLPLLLSVIVAGLCFGSAPLSVSQLLAALTGTGAESIRLILLQIRLPRVLAGCLAGVGLSTAGVLLQTVTANDLASPNVIGINSGAGLAVILTLTFAPKAGWLLPLGAFLGAMGAAMVILLAGSRIGSSRSSVVLIGIAVTTLCNAVISLLSLLDEGILAQYNHFTVGSLRDVRLGSLIAPGILILAGFCLALGLAGRLGVLSLGDEAAAALGIRVKRLRLAALACAAACAAAVVSFAGLLGFVGLIVPHIMRRLVGEDSLMLLASCALGGGGFLTICDVLARTVVAPYELSVGIVLSLLGGPFFIWLLLRQRGGRSA